jgi:hypothetical protein
LWEPKNGKNVVMKQLTLMMTSSHGWPLIFHRIESTQLYGGSKARIESFVVKLLHTWENSIQLDDRAIANDAAAYCRKYPIEYLLYSRRTSGAVAARMQPAGIPIHDMDSDYPQSVTSFWEQLIVRGSSTGIKPHSRSKSFQLCNCAVEMEVGSLAAVPANRLFVLP